MNPVSSMPARPEVVPPSMGKHGPAPLGVPSQDPREQAQIPISAAESRRERRTALAGGGVVAGAITGGALGTAVAGPVGTLFGATLGAALGAMLAVAMQTRQTRRTRRTSADRPGKVRHTECPPASLPGARP